MSNNYIEEIFLILESLEKFKSQRKEIEETLNLLADKLSSLTTKTLSDENKIIWSNKLSKSLTYSPKLKNFHIHSYGNHITQLSDLSETEFWNVVEYILGWIFDMCGKLNEIKNKRADTIIKFQNLKSLLIQTEKEKNIDLGMGFFKNDNNDN